MAENKTAAITTMFRAPFLMQGKRKIAEVFGVKPQTVVDWVENGAPIFMAGGKWQADYYNLIAWLEQVKPAAMTRNGTF